MKSYVAETMLLTSVRNDSQKPANHEYTVPSRSEGWTP